jgi:hypothetical protein
MGLFDKKSTSNQTTNDYTTVTNTAVGGADQRAAGDNSIIGGNITAENISGDVNMVDYGTVEKSFDFATGSLDAATNIAANAFTLTDTATTNALLFGQNALATNLETMKLTRDITGDAFESVFKNSSAALNFAENSSERALDFAAGANSDSLDFAAESQRNSLTSLDKANLNLSQIASNAINKVSDVVKAANTSDSVQTIQYIIGGVIAVAVVFMFLKAPKGSN